MFRTLADLGINLEMISTSPIKISCMIARDRIPEAVRALHDAFALEREPEREPRSDRCSPGGSAERFALIPLGERHQGARCRVATTGGGWLQPRPSRASSSRADGRNRARERARRGAAVFGLSS